MELNHKYLSGDLTGFTELPGKIESITKDSFELVYGSAEASKYKEIVYIWAASKEIPRLSGKSRILYIGQTKNSIKSRYYKYANLHSTSKANNLKFNHIVSKYGPISIFVSPFRNFGNSLRQSEGQLLWWYFQNHLEYPPINYSKTKVRNDTVFVENFGKTKGSLR
ncbi:hypothetical protein [Oleiphilus sp. HI0128]|uniref:hypothetical protein n=1 Tax=Oleiphilus sp. HI0128 TaxID=1822267 RepID=UPI0007C36245|nr:hypothetical protein [Oleiphilus sp. HI0128]KZY38608.1 hypothetical protein A3729_15850 [Oleiphilus sp. HI0043]KZZ66675.1 hypothetical protein A3763_16985 [Oleiphilus sp. HI0128]